MKYSNYATVPRWAGFKKYLFKVSVLFNLSLTIKYNDKGLFKEDIVFEVEGEEKDINNFKEQIVSDMERYNTNRRYK